MNHTKLKTETHHYDNVANNSLHESRIDKKTHEHHHQHIHQTVHNSHGHHDHHSHMVADFRQGFWFALALTVPVLVLSPMIQQFLGVGDVLRFSNDIYVLLLFASMIFIYGGYPFLKGMLNELRAKSPGMR